MMARPLGGWGGERGPSRTPPGDIGARVFSSRLRRVFRFCALPVPGVKGEAGPCAGVPRGLSSELAAPLSPWEATSGATSGSSAGRSAGGWTRTRPTVEQLDGDGVACRAGGWTDEVVVAEGADRVTARADRQSDVASVTGWIPGCAVAGAMGTADIDGEGAAGIGDGVAPCAVAASTAPTAAASAVSLTPTWAVATSADTG